MKTKILNLFHTFHPEANAEMDRLRDEERRITLALARRGEVDAEPAKKRRMSDASPDLEAELEQVRADMKVQSDIVASGVVRLHVKALSRGEWRRLMIEHPPREDDPFDERVGYNVDTFGEALIKACLIRCDTLDGEPVENEWDAWADEMPNGHWEDIFRACLSLCTEGIPTVFPR